MEHKKKKYWNKYRYRERANEKKATNQCSIAGPTQEPLHEEKNDKNNHRNSRSILTLSCLDSASVAQHSESNEE
jgi:hypothetical protein